MKTPMLIGGIVLALAGVGLMSASSAKLNAITDPAQKNSSPWIAGVVFGVIMILAGIFVIYKGFTSSGNANMNGTAPSSMMGSATGGGGGPNATNNPVQAIELAAQNKGNNARHTLANATRIENAARELNAVMKASTT
jgi:hypothetical protein